MAAIVNVEEYDEHGHKKKTKRDMSDFQVLKRIVGFLQERRYRKYLISFFIVVIVGSIVGFLFPWLFNRLVTDGLNGGVSGGFDKDAFYYWGKILILCMFISFFVWISQQFIIFYLANNVMYQMRKRLFKNLQRLSFDYFDDANRSSGKIISYLTNDVETIHQLISAGLLNVVAHLLNLIGSLVLMFYTSVVLSIISFIVISIVVLTGVPFLLKARQYFIIMRRKVAEVTGNLQESISGSRLIKAFAYEEQDLKRFKKSIEEELKINLKVQKLFAAMPGIMMSVMGGGLGIILLVSAKLMESGGVTGIGDIFQFVLYMIQFFGPIAAIVMFVNEIQNSMTAGERIIKLIDLKPTISNKRDLLELTEQGQLLFESLVNKRDAIKKYGKQPVSEILKLIENIDSNTLKLIKTVGEISVESKKTYDMIRLSKKYIIHKDKFIEFCLKYNELFEPFKKNQLDKISLSENGYILFKYLSSAKRAKKEFGIESISKISKYDSIFSKEEKKLYKLIGSGSAYALPSPRTTEIDSLYEYLEISKEELLRIYSNSTKFLIRNQPFEIEKLQGHIEFKNVSFSYVPGVPIIKNLTMDIKPGERVAIVGYTGAGKSTIISLLSRFYDIDSGSILVDGHDIRDINIQSLRQKMGTVLQDNYLFSGSVMENIRYGRPDATDEEIINSAKKVGAHDFIMNLPKGYHTEVEERGNLLSIGQKQLIAFTRALIRNPPVLILDEATSAVDPYSELIIQQALEVLLKNRTSISIAHRLSTIINSDKIYCLKDGVIVESGSHEELIKNPKGLYYQLYTLQFRDAFSENTENLKT